MGCLCGRQSVIIQNQKFFIVRQIGEGSFSYVYEARNTADSHQYAIKKISCHTDEEEKRAKDELTNYQRFSHPNLVSLLYHEIVEHQRTAHVTCTVYFVFPYFQKGSLHDVVRRQTRWSTGALLELFLSICHGVKNIHEQQMAHRDLKPSNIMIANGTQAVIVDFGSMTPATISMKNRSEAQRWQDWAEENCCIQYRAAELFNIQTNSIITSKSDIFSLGGILYACLFGKGPFEDVYSRGDSVALAATSGRISMPIQSNTYPTSLIETMRSMLSSEAENRPTIDEAIDRLTTISHQAINFA